MSPIDHQKFSFLFCPRCGSKNFHLKKVFHYQCDSCQLDYFINASAAVAGFIKSTSGKLLWIRREKDPGKGKLAVPGGFLDPGENATQALTREVQEEVGLHLNEWTFLYSGVNQYEYNGIFYPTLDLFFVGLYDSEQEPKPLDQVLSVEWKDPQEVDPDQIAFLSMKEAFTRYLQIYR